MKNNHEERKGNVSLPKERNEKTRNYFKTTFLNVVFTTPNRV